MYILYFSSVGASASVQGQVKISGLGKRWQYGRTLDKKDVENLLKKAFCGEITPGSIVTESCNLHVLDYDTDTGVADYILTFDILDAGALETDLDDINTNIATNPAFTNSGQTASPGTISKCIC